MGEMLQTSTEWRTCIDFGTAASKASTCAPWRQSDALYTHVHPLKLGEIGREPSLHAAESALLFHDGRVFFGWNASRRASHEDVESEILHSFKTFLSAADLTQALGLRLKRSVERSNRLTQRDALVLYVAYLLHLVDAATASDQTIPQSAADCPRRYCYPTWRTGAAANAILAEIFDHAATIVEMFGDDLSRPNGIEIDAILPALQRRDIKMGKSRIEVGVYEAKAAAECHFAFTRGLPHHLIVFDMGAGTTDITSFELKETGDGYHMREIANSRRTILLASDEVDKLLMSFMLERARVPKGRKATLFWRRMLLHRRSLKERLFADGKVHFEWERTRVEVRLRDFERDKHFMAFQAAVAQNFKYCLTQVELRAAAAGHDEVGIILAGGGASLPFVQKMATQSRHSVRGIKRLALQPIVPAWARAPELGQLAQIFPQVAISIGGAVAQIGGADRSTVRETA